MNSKDRFNMILEHKKTNHNKLAKEMGVTTSGLYDISNPLKPNVGVSKKVLLKIKKVYPDISESWLMFGEGKMLISENRSETHLSNNIERGVPYYDIDISASLTESFSDVKEEPEFYVDFRPFNDCTVYLPVFGDSMYPLIASGEIVALKKVDNPESIQYGEPHLIITNSEYNNMRTLKIIRKHQNDEMIILKPVNPLFDEMTIPRKSIISLYIVKGKITRKQL